MAKAVKVTRYLCGECSHEFRTEKGALQCENLDRWEKTFKYPEGTIVEILMGTYEVKGQKMQFKEAFRIITRIDQVIPVRRQRKFYYRLNWNNHTASEEDILRVYREFPAKTMKDGSGDEYIEILVK